MKIALTGATGRVGRFLLRHMHGRITTVGRRPIAGLDHVAWDLDDHAPDLSGFDALVHAAFSHVPNRYRGGEGNDPEGFLHKNLNGTCRLFDAAAQHGVGRVIFLSSRAVFDGHPNDTVLTETCPPKAQSLYGQVKIATENHLFDLPLTGMSLRATGVYGPGKGHKWEPMFRDFLAGQPPAPRRGTELHGKDLAQAVNLLLNAGQSGAYHASDIRVDNHELLHEINTLHATLYALPEKSSRTVNPLICEKLGDLGWQPGGWDLLRQELPQLLATV